MTNELQKVGKYDHCPKCGVELDPHKLDVTMSHICPVCCAYTNVITITDEVATEDQLKKKQGEKIYYDILKIIDNWKSAYVKALKDGSDYSAIDEFQHDLVEHMGMWLKRLQDEGFIDKPQLKQITDHAMSGMDDIQNALEAEEEIMRLTGTWTDQDEEIKQYWIERLKIKRLPYEKKGEIE